EVPAIWCLESIFLCAIIVKTPLRRWLHVDSWYALPLKVGNFGLRRRRIHAGRAVDAEETRSRTVAATDANGAGSSTDLVFLYSLGEFSEGRAPRAHALDRFSGVEGRLARLAEMHRQACDSKDSVRKAITG